MTTCPFTAKKCSGGRNARGIQSVDDLSRLPFTNKSDIRDNYPYGLFAAPMEDIVRIQGSSGTTGKLTIVGYTRNDLNVWSEVAARSLTCAGVTKKSIVQDSYGYGLFTGGLGAHGGAELIGATVIPMSGRQYRAAGNGFKRFEGHGSGLYALLRAAYSGHHG